MVLSTDWLSFVRGQGLIAVVGDLSLLMNTGQALLLDQDMASTFCMMPFEATGQSSTLHRSWLHILMHSSRPCLLLLLHASTLRVRHGRCHGTLLFAHVIYSRKNCRMRNVTVLHKLKLYSYIMSRKLFEEFRGDVVDWFWTLKV